MEPVINVKNLSKHFGEIRAVQDLSFSVEKGSVYGFLGQNGAGKSTTIRVLLSLVRPSAGEISVFGLDLSRHRQQILRRTGAIIEKPDLYKYLTAIENLRLFATMSGIRPGRKKLMDQLALVGLAERADSKVKTFSQGMKQRLGIAVALIHDPELVILDEPVNGLDPQGIADIRNLVRHLSRDRGKTILISSHLLSEIEQVADTMLIIDKGRKVVEGKKDLLLNPERTDVELETPDAEKAAKCIQASAWGSSLLKTGENKIILQVKRDEMPRLIRELAAMDMDIISIRPKHTLEDYFLSLTVSS